MSLKIKLSLGFILLCSLNSFAQSLTPEEKIIFDVVAFDRTKIGEYEKTQKWVIPIRYKIYGDTSSYLVKEVDSNFSEIRRLTSLDIQKTSDEGAVNFMIVFGKTPQSFEPYTMNGKPLESAGSYRKRVNKNSEIYWAQNLINIQRYGSRLFIRNALKRQALKVLGFQKTTDALSNSLFSSASNGKTKFDDFDSHIIRTLYLPTVKPGMTIDEVNKALGFEK